MTDPQLVDCIIRLTGCEDTPERRRVLEVFFEMVKDAARREAFEQARYEAARLSHDHGLTERLSDLARGIQ